MKKQFRFRQPYFFFEVGGLSSLSLSPCVQRSVIWQILDTNTVWLQLVLAQQLLILVSLESSEAPLVRDVDLNSNIKKLLILNRSNIKLW